MLNFFVKVYLSELEEHIRMNKKNEMRIQALIFLLLPPT